MFENKTFDIKRKRIKGYLRSNFKQYLKYPLQHGIFKLKLFYCNNCIKKYLIKFNTN
jgi:hypothetical protein